MNLLFDLRFEITQNLSLGVPSERFLRRHRLLLSAPLKTLSLYCSAPINQPFVVFMCLHKQSEGTREREEGRERAREETDSQDLDEPWEKRGLVEEKQKCLRTFLCDYKVRDKSRHSCSYSVSYGSS